MQTSVHQHNQRYLWRESEPHYSGKLNSNMNKRHNKNYKESEKKFREYEQYTEREPESLSIKMVLIPKGRSQSRFTPILMRYLLCQLAGDQNSDLSD